jgi:hypothetical protein
MRFLLKFNFPTESGNTLTASPEFGKNIQELLKEIKAEAACLCPVGGERGGFEDMLSRVLMVLRGSV